jgi:ACS family hexuronate transporter-like MFS transporter
MSEVSIAPHASPVAGASVVDVPAPAARDVTAVAPRAQWVAIGIFMLFSALNFLDRQLMAAVAPSIITEYGLTNAAYGTLLAAFSFTYMVAAPIAGLLVDRVGLHLGAMVAVGAWSLAGAATGITSTFRGLLACRMALGLTEAAAIPCSSKASAVFLPPAQQGVGIALQSIGITLGSVAAPLLVVAVAPRFGWRAAFIVCGLAGLLWIPLWWYASRRIPGRVQRAALGAPATVRGVLTDMRLWGILGANVLIMTVHSMWLNWTTIYFVRMHGLTQVEANWYFAWIPPIFATLGHLTGAWLAMRVSRDGRDPMAVRRKICIRFAPLLLVTAAVPLMPSPALAAAAISLSFFSVMLILNNLHIIPIDLFGAQHAAFTTAILAGSYAVLQVVLSPVMGAMADRFGFGALCVVVSVLPMLAALVLRVTLPAARPATAM